MSSFDLKPIKQPSPIKKGKINVDSSNISDLFSKDIKLFSKGFNDRKKEKFYSELSILINAGIDLKSAFEIIIDQIEQVNDKKLIELVKQKVLAGDSLSNAMEATGKFSPYEFYSIRIGEESGKLTNVLKDLGLYFAGKIQQKRLFLNALSYPIVVLLTAFGAVFFMMKFV
ncbi:MAG TPA: type II secretion system F family protein, partial [Bacteroidia bacterium]|nr:type II secretion system F family protein [Bacteroidia bacterium]